jgi:thiamine-phosphate pyrophosphorylase
MPFIEKLHHLTQDHPVKSHVEQALAALKGGARWIQLRVKGKSDPEWEAIAWELRELTKRHEAILIINDNPILAKKVGADGVHLGRTDMPLEDARKMLGEGCIIGATANNEEELKAALNSEVDYIGLGPYRYTQTKKNLSKVIELEELKRLACMQNRVPVVLIGGIRIEDLEIIKQTGAYGIAVSSAINLAKEPEKEAAQFVEFFKNN